LKFRSVKLVPGGRYLLATTSKSIYLWDLGYSPKIIKPDERPLTAYTFPEGCKPTVGRDHRAEIVVAQDSQDAKLVLAVLTTSVSYPFVHLSILHDVSFSLDLLD
jgi:hypothetical protein